MSAIDVLGKLDGFDVNLLGSLQRVLLVTDGTLTEILEAYFAERIVLVKVAQQVIPATASHALLNPIVGETLIERKILLQGTRSRSNYVYAESLVAVDRLAPSFRDALLTSDTPLGRSGWSTGWKPSSRCMRYAAGPPPAWHTILSRAKKSLCWRAPIASSPPAGW